MPQNEQLSDAVKEQATNAVERLNRILKSLDRDHGVPELAVTYVELRACL